MRSIENVWYQYHQKLLSFIKQKVGNDVAEDILQDVFVKIHTQVDSLKESNKLESWLFQVTRNTIVDYYRSRKPTEALPDWLEQKNINDDEKIRKELSLCLEPMVKMLPDKYKKAVQLSEIEGKTQQEVARLEGISLSGAKSRVQRGRKLLKEILNDCCQIEINRNNQPVSYEPKEQKCKIC
jgi:RNA polymerase sigma-70 factor (ECF subfamily)